jgi:hypothetical protein
VLLPASAPASTPAAIPTVSTPTVAPQKIAPQTVAASSPTPESARRVDAAQGGPLLLLALGVDGEGRVVQRVVESTGLIVERTIDPATGNVLERRPVGSVMGLALTSQRPDSLGNVLRVVRDVTGGLVELTIGQGGVLTRMRTLRLGSIGVATAQGDRATQVVPAPLAAPPAVHALVPSPMPSAVAGAPPTAPPVARVAPVTPVTPLTSPAGVAAAIDSASAPPPLFLGEYTNERGHLVQRFVEASGNITERYLNAAGQLVVRKRAANARLLPLVREYVSGDGEFVRIVRDPLGALLELTFARDGKLARLEMLRPGTIQPSAAPAADRSTVRERAPSIAARAAPSGAPASSPGPAATVTAPPVAAVLSQHADALGQLAQRVVDTDGKIVERTLDAAGKVLQRREVGSILQLRVVSRIPQSDGRIFLIARDLTGALLEVVLGPDRRVTAVRPLDPASSP